MEPRPFSRTVIFGAIGFCAASLCVFATVAFGERWMYSHLGIAGSYLAWTILFIALGGGVIGAQVTGRWRLPRFFLLFAIAFFAYAIGWTGAYFSLHGSKVGEWAGSVVGSLLMGSILAAGVGALRSALRTSFVLFIGNSFGYFIGSALNDLVRGRPGMLLWGAVYGLCLGAGLAAGIYLAQSQRDVVT
jgi:hypothetical protein